MRKHYLTVFTMGLTLFITPVLAEPPPGMAEDYQATDTRVLDVGEYINANKLLMCATNVGAFANDWWQLLGKSDGLYYPYVSVEAIQDRSLTRTVMYSAGLWVGGRVNGETRVTVAEFSHEYGPGPMTAGGSYQPWAFDDPAFRVYKLHADSLESNPNQDYLEWPASQGAPVDGAGQPAMLGDQMLWTVFNDADASLHTNRAGRTEPLGVEVQQRVWAVDEDGDDTITVHDPIVVLGPDDSRMEVEVGVDDYNALTGHDYRVITLGLDTVEVVKSDTFFTYYFLPDTCDSIWDGDSMIYVNCIDTVIDDIVTDTFDVQVPSWELHDVTLGAYHYFEAIEADVDGMHIKVRAYDPRIDSWEWGPIPENRPITGLDWGGSGFWGGLGTGWEFFGTSLGCNDYVPIEIRWVADGSGQKAYMYRRDQGYLYNGYFDNQNIEVWDISIQPPRQVNFAFVEYYAPQYDGGMNSDSIWNPGEQLDMWGSPDYWGGREYLFILNSDYSPVEDPRYMVDWAIFGPPDADFDCLAAGWVRPRSGTDGKPDSGSYLRVFPEPCGSVLDTFSFSSNISPPLIITTGPEGLSIYMEYKLYNKGGNYIDDCRVSIWSDPDLGGAADDLVGCDTLDNLWFCYNGHGRDDQYDSLPPSVGFKLLLGPLVPSPDDTAFFDGQLWPGYKNLEMTSFAKFINGTDPQSVYETYNYMQGLLANGSPYTYEGQILKYHHSGDPVTGSGDIDGNATDVRMLANMGPFTFNPGDSQYVLVKLAVGQGADRLLSVTHLKQILNVPFETPSCCYFRGDLNHSGGSNPIDISDLVYLVNVLYGDTEPPHCMDDADVNASGGVDITDLVYLVDHMFRGGPPPPPCD